MERCHGIISDKDYPVKTIYNDPLALTSYVVFYYRAKFHPVPGYV
jgi:hypothetical protein